MTENEKSEIYSMYRKKVYGYILNHICNADTAEDICADVFLKVYEKLDSFNAEKSSLSTWIYTVTRNTLTDYYRTRKVPEEIPESIPTDTSVENEIESKEDLEILATALESLDEKERTLIVLRYYKGVTLTEIAKNLGMSYSYAKVLHNKALSKLKKYF